MTVAAMAALLAVAALAGCSGDEPDKPNGLTPSATTALPDRAPDPNQRCGFASSAERVTIRSEDGVALAGADLGSGSRGVVLLHQRGDTMCGWGGYADRLVAAGFHVVAIDLRCNGFSDCDRDDVPDDLSGVLDFAADAGAAIGYLHQAGAAKVIVMGASLGAATAMVAAGRYADQVSGVVGLSVFSFNFNASGPASTEIRTPLDAASATRVPMLIALGTGDPSSISQGQAETLVDRGAAKDHSVIVARSTSLHGWDMLREPATLDAVLAFLRQNT